MSQVRLVRIHRFDPSQGYVRKKYRTRVGMHFLKFDAMNPEWVRVSSDIAEILSKERQQPNSPMSPPLFEIQTEDGAKKVEAAERAAREAAKRKLEPTVDSARDMTSISLDGGRGDLSIDEIAAGRRAALEASANSAAGMLTPPSSEPEPESNPEPELDSELKPRKKRKYTRRTDGKKKSK